MWACSEVMLKSNNLEFITWELPTTISVSDCLVFKMILLVLFIVVSWGLLQCVIWLRIHIWLKFSRVQAYNRFSIGCTFVKSVMNIKLIINDLYLSFAFLLYVKVIAISIAKSSTWIPIAYDKQEIHSHIYICTFIRDISIIFLCTLLHSFRSSMGILICFEDSL